MRAWDVFAKCREADLREGASVPRPPRRRPTGRGESGEAAQNSETTGAGGVPPHSPLPSGSPESLVDPAPFSVFSLVLFSQSCEELFVEVRFAHCEARGGGAPTLFSPSAYHDFKHFHHPRKFPHLPPCPCGRTQCTFCVLTVFPLRTKQAFPLLPRRTLSRQFILRHGRSGSLQHGFRRIICIHILLCH